MKRVYLLVFVVVLAFSAVGRAPAQDLNSAEETQKRKMFEKLIKTAQRSGSVRVIARLNLEVKPVGQLRQAEFTGQRVKIKKEQENFLNRHRASFRGSDDSVKLFEFIPFLAFETDAAMLEQMRSDASITSIEEDVADAPTLLESTNIVGAPAAWSAGFNGSGWAVAVLDTGVMKTHGFLAGKVISEACFSQTVAGSSQSVCPGGVSESIDAGSGINCDPAVTGCAHGTHVAGIAAGSGSSFSGVAKGANIVAVQVFSRFDTAASCGSSPAPCALSYVSDQIKGLERVLALSGSTNIAAVNMSLGGGQNTATCDLTQAARKAAIDNLRSVNIATVISSGNNGYTNAMGAPACISTAVSVGSTGDGSSGATVDSVSGFSNSVSFLSLLAPGQWISSSVSVTGGSTTVFQNYSGTSMAAPHVAGAFAILRQRRPTATVSKILNTLIATGQPVTDSRNGVVRPRIKIFDAVQAIVKNSSFDFDGDNKTDISIFRPSNGQWWFLKSSDNTNFAVTFGTSTDKLVPADYTGDGKTDVALFRPSTGEWFILRSDDFSYYAFPFGASSDIPAPGDYDGDGRADAAVFRDSSGTWYINKSTGGIQTTTFGTANDQPISADWDGDGKTDIAVYRRALAEWWILGSLNGNVIGYDFGAGDDKTVQGDYTGDGKADPAFFNTSNSTWYVQRSEGGGWYATAFGTLGDIAAPGDYDGDGIFDLAVFRPTNNTWYFQRSTGGNTQTTFGVDGDLPTPNAYVR